MRSSHSVDAGEILEFVRQRGLLVESERAALAKGRTVTNVCADVDANATSLSWLSDRVARSEPARALSFKGALLLASSHVASSDAPADNVVRCHNPKLAFTLVVHRFFAHLLGVQWPSKGAVSDEVTIAPDASLAPGALVGPGCAIGKRVVIGPNTVLANTIIGDDVIIGANCSIGLPGYGYERDEHGAPIRFPHLGTVRIADNVEIGSNVCIDRGSLGATSIGEHCKIDNLVHIAHNVVLESGCMVIANSMIAGSVRAGRNVWFAPSTSVLNQVQLEAEAVLGMGAVVIRNVAAGTTVVGNPARELARREPNRAE